MCPNNPKIYFDFPPKVRHRVLLNTESTISNFFYADLELRDIKGLIFNTPLESMELCIIWENKLVSFDIAII